MIPPLFATPLVVNSTNSPFFEPNNFAKYDGGTISQGGDYNTNRKNVIISGTLDNSGTLTNSGILTSSGTLNNSGILVNSNGNTLTNSGFLNNSNIFNNSGTLTFNMGSILQRTGTLRLTGGSVVDQNNTQLNWPIQVFGNTSITSGLGNTFTLNAEITGTVGSLVFNGPGTTKLIKDNTGYTGGLEIQQGVVSINEDTNLGAEDGLLAMGTDTGTNDTAGTLQTTGVAPFTSARAITLNQGGGIFDTAEAGATLTGVITGTGSLTKKGIGPLSLSGNNGYSGGTNVNIGTLLTAGEDTLPQNGPITVALGAILDLAGNDQTIGSLTGDGEVELGTASLTTGGDNISTEFEGAISGEGKLIKKGTEIFTLSGLNEYTGGTFIEQGSLRAGDEGTLPTEGPVTLASGATLALANNDQAIGSLAGDGEVTLGTATLKTGDDTDTSFTGGISGQGGGLHKVGTGTFTLSGANTYTGGTFIDEGTLQTAEEGTLPTKGPVTVKQDATLDLADKDQTIGSLAGDGEVTLGTAALTTGDDTDTSFTGGISGQGGGLHKVGTGTFTLSGANTYTGGTFIDEGTLIGDTNSLPGDIDNNGTLIFKQGFDQAYAEVMSGPGIFRKQGNSALALTGQNTYTGPTFIDEGSLVMNFVQQPDAGIATVGAAGILKGTGTIQDKVINQGGTVSPGTGIDFESLTLVNGYEGQGTMEFLLDSAGNNSKLL